MDSIGVEFVKKKKKLKFIYSIVLFFRRIFESGNSFQSVETLSFFLFIVKWEKETTFSPWSYRRNKITLLIRGMNKKRIFFKYKTKWKRKKALDWYTEGRAFVMIVRKLLSTFCRYRAQSWWHQFFKLKFILSLITFCEYFLKKREK